MNFTHCVYFLPLLVAAASAAPVDNSRFEKEVLASGCNDTLQLDVAADGRVFFIERKGTVKMCEPTSRRTVTIGNFPAQMSADAGALGLALAPDFAKSGHLYTIRVPAEGLGRLVVARHTLGGESLTDEKAVLTIPLREGKDQFHCGAGLAFDAQGNLLIGVGDNMPPQDVPAIHSEDTGRDARGTAGNSQELRGKILRITPKPDGTYGIPAGNLWTDAGQGKAEIFAFGVRNPFRVTCDAKTGLIIWGDVGNNVRVEFDLGPEGFDEINATREPGFFGWPFCTGPNAPWRQFDPETKKPAGEYYIPEKLLNDSKANTGLKELPPARPAALYYNNTASKEWSFTGSGGRSITGGLVYRKPATAGETRLPDEWEGAYLFGEWMRNWVAAARFDEAGKLLQTERVLQGMTFKRPADFKVGPDGALYIAEFGDGWRNKDSQITRVVYRRGNRAPLAVVNISRATGKLPMEVTFDALGSSDPDGDGLKYLWMMGDYTYPMKDKVTHTFTTAGIHQVTLEVTDAHGAKALAHVNIAAGNEAPQVAFTAPQDGGFLDGKSLPWKVSAEDAEDGAVAADRLLIQMEKRDRAAANGAGHPGLALMKRTTCFACHSATEKSAGPPYSAIAVKYAAESGVRDKLAAKIITGGAGVWGELPMPPHPQHTPAEAALMADWVLSLAQRQIQTLPTAGEGSAALPESTGGWGRVVENTVIVLTAATTDKGAGTLPPLSGVAEVMLRSRKQRASCFDRSENAAAQDNLDQGGLVARIQPGGWIAFDRIRVQDFKSIKLGGWAQGKDMVDVNIMAGDKVLVQKGIPSGSAVGKPQEFTLSMPDADAGAAPQQVKIKLIGPSGSLLDLMWVEFQKE